MGAIGKSEIRVDALRQPGVAVDMLLGQDGRAAGDGTQNGDLVGIRCFLPQQVGDTDPEQAAELLQLGLAQVHLAGFDLGNGRAVFVSQPGGEGFLGKALFFPQGADNFTSVHGFAPNLFVFRGYYSTFPRILQEFFCTMIQITKKFIATIDKPWF